MVLETHIKVFMTEPGFRKIFICPKNGVKNEPKSEIFDFIDKFGI